MGRNSTLKSLKSISKFSISQENYESYINSFGVIAHIATYGAQANCHSQGCSSCLPARASLHARVSRFSPPSRGRAKRVSARPVKIFCGGCRAFIRRRLLANSRMGAESRANLVSRCPVRIRSFPHIWLRPRRCSLGKRML